MLSKKKYWTTDVNAAIKSMVSKCVVCHRYQARAGQRKIADVPRERVIPDQTCFSSVGMDYFGPIEVKRRFSLYKRGVIFVSMKHVMLNI